MHTKMLLTERAVMFGSANWTNHSVLEACDLNVLMQTEREIHEAFQFFEILWSSAGEENNLTDAKIAEHLLLHPTNAQNRRN